MSKSTFIQWIIFLIVALWILCLPVLCKAAPAWKFYVMGVDISEIRAAKAEDCGKMILGAVASLGAHIAGHYIAAELFDVKLSQVGFTEVIDYSANPSARDIQWMGRGGFLFQLGINTLLVEYAGDSYFTKGFTGFTSLELVSYPVRRAGYGDFVLIDENGGNGNLEYFLYSTWAAHNLWRLNQ